MVLTSFFLFYLISGVAANQDCFCFLGDVNRASSLSNGVPCPSSPLIVPISDPIEYLNIRNALETLEEQIQSTKNSLNISAVSSILVYDQQIVWFQNLGYADPFNQVPSTSDTGYRIGSLTKIFTALMLFVMRDKGIISLDDEVESYEPKLSNIRNMYQFNTTKKFTFRQLASHTAGLPDEASCQPPEWTCNDSEVYEYINNLTLILPMYSQPSYSNFGFAILGQVLAKIWAEYKQLEYLDTNSVYEDFIVSEILTPWQMERTGFNFSDEVKEFMATGFYQDGSVAPLYNTGYDTPNGQMYSTANDLAKFMMLMFRDNRPEDSSTQILDGTTIREMQLPIFVNDDGKTAWSTPWEMIHLDNQWLRTKLGNVDGYSAHIALAPKLKLGLVVLASLDGIDASTMTIPNMYELTEAFTCTLAFLQQNPPLPDNIKDYLGTFGNGGSTVIFSIKNGKFIARFSDGSKAQLIWIEESTFMMRDSSKLSSCMTRAFDALDGELAQFSLESPAMSVEFPGYQFLNILWKRIS